MNMNISLYSIIAGSEACNARCPYCVSKMTPNQGLDIHEPEINWRNFSKGALLAKDARVNTVMLTGKGEPTLFPEQITRYMKALTPYNFPFIELQTNGLRFHYDKEKMLPYLKEWYELGMTLIAISVVHHDPEKNRDVFTPHMKEYIDIPGVVKMLHDEKYSIRLSCVMADGYIDSPGRLEEMISFSMSNKVEQLTIRPINKPGKSRCSETKKWVDDNHLKEGQLDSIARYLESKGTLLLSLPHGGAVYDVEGQNICLTNSLTLSRDTDMIRQLIFFPDGHLRYDWQHEGAVLL